LQAEYEETAPGILMASTDILSTGPEIVQLLKQKAAENPLMRARLCAHRENDDPLHEMLIALQRGVYIRPHRHGVKSESMHAIEGRFLVVLFSDDGAIERVVDLAPPGESESFFYRLSVNHFHTVIPLSPTVVFHETTNGPYHRRQTEFAPWSPHEDEAAKAADFMSSLMGKIGHAA
jgi:cupin fold WbuC family metalloprotein